MVRAAGYEPGSKKLKTYTYGGLPEYVDIKTHKAYDEESPGHEHFDGRMTS
tara:strand:- start:1029 stop:1181 length:153 start_codon:yes stop_codon:yes gene_type:complete